MLPRKVFTPVLDSMSRGHMKICKFIFLLWKAQSSVTVGCDRKHVLRETTDAPNQPAIYFRGMDLNTLEQVTCSCCKRVFAPIWVQSLVQRLYLRYNCAFKFKLLITKQNSTLEHGLVRRLGRLTRTTERVKQAWFCGSFMVDDTE